MGSIQHSRPGGGAATFAGLTGDPGDNAALATALAARPVLLAYAEAATVSAVVFDGIFDAALFAGYQVIASGLSPFGSTYKVFLTLRDASGDVTSPDYVSGAVVNGVDTAWSGTRNNSASALGWDVVPVGMLGSAHASLHGLLLLGPAVQHLHWQSIVPIYPEGVYSYTSAGILGTTAPITGLKFRSDAENLSGRFAVYGLPK